MGTQLLPRCRRNLCSPGCLAQGAVAGGAGARDIHVGLLQPQTQTFFPLLKRSKQACPQPEWAVQGGAHGWPRAVAQASRVRWETKPGSRVCTEDREPEPRSLDKEGRLTARVYQRQLHRLRAVGAQPLCSAQPCPHSGGSGAIPSLICCCFSMSANETGTVQPRLPRSDPFPQNRPDGCCLGPSVPQELAKNLGLPI